MCKKCITEIRSILVAHKKKIWSMVIVVILLAALSAGAHAMFRVEGIVTAIDNNHVTVANFFRTQTIDLTGVPANITTIRLGDKITIQKTLQGNILYIKTHSSHNQEHEHKNKHS
jgi:hypothetical protein